MSVAGALRARCDMAKEQMRDVVRLTALELQQGMKELAPVDTGRLKANFQCGIGSANRITTSAIGDDAVLRARQVLVGWQGGQDIYLTNALPYARLAEFGLYGKPPGSANGPKTSGGYPSQSIGGFVRLTAQRFDDIVRHSVAQVKR